MVRKRQDPRVVKLLDEEAKQRVRFEALYARLKRTFTAMEKCRRKIVSIQRRVRKLEEVTP